jgi:glycosyltransferase involved in cell wall biosynthesis
MSTVRVSVVLPTHRRPTFLTRALDSVRSQTMQAWELIVVDDNEPDSEHRRETEAVMRNFRRDPRIRYLRHARNRGGAAARNSGIVEATGEFVGFLDDDDAWHPTKLELQLARFDASGPGVALVYCRARVVEHGAEVPSVRRSSPAAHDLRALLKRNVVGSTSCVLCRRTALLAIGSFDESLPAKQDIDLYVRMAQRFEFALVDEPLVTLHHHAQGRIGKDLQGAIRAHEIFHAKHWALIEPYPEVVHHRLLSLGQLLLAAERHDEARALLRRAWRVRRWDRATLLRLALTFRWPRAAARMASRLARSARRGEPQVATTQEPP